MISNPQSTSEQTIDNLSSSVNHQTNQIASIISSSSVFVSSSETIESKSTSENKPLNKLVMDWLKSPLGSTITTGVFISFFAMGGAYWMGQNEKVKIQQEQDNFLAQLEEYYNLANYVSCFEAVEKEQENQSKDNYLLTDESKKYIGKCRLAEAQQQAQIGDYNKALEVVAQIRSDDEDYHKQAQIYIQDWSAIIFNQAKLLYAEEGDLDGATEKVNLIIHEQVKEDAFSNLRLWQDEYKRNSYLRTQAERDLEYGNCDAAINTVSEIFGSNYWLLEGKKIVDKAQKCLEDQGTIIIPNTTYNNTDFNRKVDKPKVKDLCQDGNILGSCE
jgi:serine/threonine-protein kinase